MSEIIKLDHISQYNELMGVETLHPLISFIDCYKIGPTRFGRKLFGFYAVIIKDMQCGDMKYGRSRYDYEQGSVVCVAPGQLMGSEDDGQLHQPEGYILMFHPDLLHGTSLARNMKNYTFFSYEVNEALHLSSQERKVVLECFGKIDAELKHPIDKYSRILIVDTIKLLLDYFMRFYDRQFITREIINKDILMKLEKLLDDYFDSDKPESLGLPSVQYCAEQFNLSPNYFSDIVKKETGTTVLKYIHLKLLDIAKSKIVDSGKSLSEIAYELGFKYPQHFSRFFKKTAGCSPNEYRQTSLKGIHI